jgi:hypothetical protein
LLPRRIWHPRDSEPVLHQSVLLCSLSEALCSSCSHIVSNTQSWFGQLCICVRLLDHQILCYIMNLFIVRHLLLTVSEKFVLTKICLCSSWNWHSGYIYNVLWSPQVSEKGWARKRPFQWRPNH